MRKSSIQEAWIQRVLVDTGFDSSKILCDAEISKLPNVDPRVIKNIVPGSLKSLSVSN